MLEFSDQHLKKYLYSSTFSHCHLLSLSLPLLPSIPPVSQTGETHMGELPAGMPAQAPNHGALTLPPSVSASPVCHGFANRTIHMVSSILQTWSPALATSEGQRDRLGDLWFFCYAEHLTAVGLYHTLTRKRCARRS